MSYLLGRCLGFTRRVEDGLTPSVEPPEPTANSEGTSDENLVTENKLLAQFTLISIRVSILILVLFGRLRLVRLGITEDARGAESSLGCRERSKDDSRASDASDERRHFDSQ